MNSNCPLCEFTEYKTIGIPKTNDISKEFVTKPYRVVQCSNCSGYFVLPKISFSDEQWSKLYHSEYFSSQSDWLLKKRAVELAERLDTAANYLAGRKKISLLDIGAGEGKTLIEGLKRGWEVIGIDIVDNRIDAAKEVNGIKFINAKFMEYNFPENCFDFIYLDSVLEHVLNPKEYLIKIRKILKVGGVVYIGVPNEDSLFNDVRKIIFYLFGRKNLSTKIKPFDAPYHVIGFNKSSLAKIFQRTNLKIQKMKNIGRKFDFLSHTPNQRGFWIALFFLLPIEFISKIINRDVYYAAYVTKEEESSENIKKNY
jgi:ubiquinone/menaquinone biosynthesis C-methylase UbiE